MADKNKISGQIKYWTILNIGTLSLAAGVYFFKSPNHFATGGVSGLSIILEPLIPFLTQSEILMIINAIMLIVGFIFLGKGCTFKTLYCSVVYSLENFAFEQLVSLDGPLTDQTFMELVFAILLTGIGSAIIFNSGATSGGTDIVALILKKFTSIHVGRALLVTDILIAAASFFVFDVQAGLFSMLGLFTKAFLIDSVIEQIGKNKYVTVITDKVEEIGDYIINTMNRDYTTYIAQGGYTGNAKHVLLVVCSRPEARRLRAKTKELDPFAFTIMTDATEILGKGFRNPD